MKSNKIPKLFSVFLLFLALSTIATARSAHHIMVVYDSGAEDRKSAEEICRIDYYCNGNLIGLGLTLSQWKESFSEHYFARGNIAAIVGMGVVPVDELAREVCKKGVILGYLDSEWGSAEKSLIVKLEEKAIEDYVATYYKDLTNAYIAVSLLKDILPAPLHIYPPETSLKNDPRMKHHFPELLYVPLKKLNIHVNGNELEDLVTVDDLIMFINQKSLEMYDVQR